MTSPNAPDPETLAKIAAQLNPQLACDDPTKAIELARKLLIAADPKLAEEEALRAEGRQLHKEGEREDKLFPRNERISVAEAFKASPGDYKTESGFAAALRKGELTTGDQDVNLAEWLKASPSKRDKFVQPGEVTSLKAVQELFSRQRKAKQARDRARKAASNKKNKKCRGIQRSKNRTNPPKSGTNPPKSGSDKAKNGSLRKRVTFPEKRADSPC